MPTFIVTGLTTNDQAAEGQHTCSQALLDLFKVLLQALPLPIQLCVFLLQLLNSAVSATVWATTSWTTSGRPRDAWGYICTRTCLLSKSNKYSLIKPKRGQKLVDGPHLLLPKTAQVKLTSCWLHQACSASQKHAPHTWGQSWLLEEQAQRCHWQQPLCQALAALL